jgi:hypothetical protein
MGKRHDSRKQQGGAGREPVCWMHGIVRVGWRGEIPHGNSRWIGGGFARIGGEKLPEMLVCGAHTTLLVVNDDGLKIQIGMYSFQISDS